MHFIDLSIFIFYLIFMLGVGFYFLRKNKSKEDYFVGGRSMSAGHIGLSVVATDVGGGFFDWTWRTWFLPWDCQAVGCYLLDCLVHG